MQDTYEDIRKHTWPDASSSDGPPDRTLEVERVATEKTEALKTELDGQIEEVLKRTVKTDEVVKELSKEMTGLVNAAIDQSRETASDAGSQTLREAIMNKVRSITKSGAKSVRASTFALPIMDLGYDVAEVFDELDQMQSEGMLRYERETGESFFPEPGERMRFFPAEEQGDEVEEKPTSQPG
jgi:hypothetical protein